MKLIGVGAMMLAIFSSCARSPNLYRVSSAGWQADSIRFTLAAIDTALHSLPDDAEVHCVSCNMVDSYWTVKLDSTGSGRVLINEANTLVSARLKVNASRLDTTIVLKERSPKDAERFFNLKTPLVGRVLLVQLGMLYTDSLQSKVATHAEPGDELNIFGETRMFYLAHHPLFSEPLYLLKNSAVRLY